MRAVGRHDCWDGRDWIKRLLLPFHPPWSCCYYHFIIHTCSEQDPGRDRLQDILRVGVGVLLFFSGSSLLQLGSFCPRPAGGRPCFHSLGLPKFPYITDLDFQGRKKSF